MSQYRLSFPSSIDHCRELRQWIGVISHIEGYGEDFTSSLELTAHEAFVNAVQHGSKNDEHLSVLVMVEAGSHDGEQYLEVRVRDFGDGFEPERAITSICSSRTGTSSCGRGLFLVSNYVTNLKIERHKDGCLLILHYIPR
jgi:serine/threonine-protein kinase RsbW